MHPDLEYDLLEETPVPERDYSEEQMPFGWLLTIPARNGSMMAPTSSTLIEYVDPNDLPPCWLWGHHHIQYSSGVLLPPPQYESLISFSSEADIFTWGDSFGGSNLHDGSTGARFGTTPQLVSCQVFLGLLVVVDDIDRSETGLARTTYLCLISSRGFSVFKTM
jgi:hypothetical protein